MQTHLRFLDKVKEIEAMLRRKQEKDIKLKVVPEVEEKPETDKPEAH
jgi:hypothetical protein